MLVFLASLSPLVKIVRATEQDRGEKCPTLQVCLPQGKTPSSLGANK